MDTSVISWSPFYMSTHLSEDGDDRLAYRYCKILNRRANEAMLTPNSRTATAQKQIKLRAVTSRWYLPGSLSSCSVITRP